MGEQSRDPLCFHCKSRLDLPSGPIGRTATCDSCDSDVRVCLNCQFYDPNSYNECSEPMAERIVEKDRSNFCDYFSLSGGKETESGERDQAMKKLDDLFK